MRGMGRGLLPHSGTDSADHAAGDLVPRISGRLRSEIIRLAVDHDCSADNIFHAKTACSHRQVCAPSARKQWREIPRVQRVLPVMWIIVAASIGKTSLGTVTFFMNVDGKEAGF